MYVVKKKVEFSAAHRLHSDSLSDEQNKKTFGWCNNPSFHGHNYTVEVLIGADEIDPKVSMVINFYDLEKILKAEIIDKVDHKNLNLDVDFLNGVNPTAENLSRIFFDLLEPKIQPAKLIAVSVSESEGNQATYYKNNPLTGLIY
jgi:6-pyruvoyltetrahydropterin/6-carboxytetrahydropterin synthase